MCCIFLCFHHKILFCTVTVRVSVPLWMFCCHRCGTKSLICFRVENRKKQALHRHFLKKSKITTTNTSTHFVCIMQMPFVFIVALSLHPKQTAQFSFCCLFIRIASRCASRLPRRFHSRLCVNMILIQHSLPCIQPALLVRDFGCDSHGIIRE